MDVIGTLVFGIIWTAVGAAVLYAVIRAAVLSAMRQWTLEATVAVSMPPAQVTRTPVE